MNLVNKIKIGSGIALGLGSLLISGCSTNGTPSLNVNDWVRNITGKDPETGLPTAAPHLSDAGRAVLLGAGIVNMGNQAAINTGNPAYGIAGEILAQTTVKNADYEQMQQAAGQQVVYVNEAQQRQQSAVQQPQQPVYVNEAQQRQKIIDTIQDLIRQDDLLAKSKYIEIDGRKYPEKFKEISTNPDYKVLGIKDSDTPGESRYLYENTVTGEAVLIKK